MRERLDWEEIARKARFASDRDAIIKLYYQQNKSIREVAERLGVSAYALTSRMDDLNLPRRGKGGAGYRLSGGPLCPYCGHSKSYVFSGYHVSETAFRRIRTCGKCKREFVTTERAENGNRHG